jgi:hypothetical protein
MMTLGQAAAAYPVGSTLRYGSNHCARVVRHYRHEKDTLVYVVVEDEHGAELHWAVDMLASSGVTVER